MKAPELQVRRLCSLHWFVSAGLVDEMIRAFVAHFEDALQSGRAASLKAGRLIQARVIIDTSGFSIKNLQHLHILRLLGLRYFG